MHPELNMAFSVVACSASAGSRLTLANPDQRNQPAAARFEFADSFFQLVKVPGCPRNLNFQLAKFKPPHTIGSSGRSAKNYYETGMHVDPAFGGADRCRRSMKFVHPGLGPSAPISSSNSIGFLDFFLSCHSLQQINSAVMSNRTSPPSAPDCRMWRRLAQSAKQFLTDCGKLGDEACFEPPSHSCAR
jgi:hypothetical protein